METASTDVMSIWRRNDIEKSTWRTHRYFVDFESRIHVDISTSNCCHNFHVDSPFKIDVISTNFPRGISTSNRWWIDEDVSIGLVLYWILNKASSNITLNLLNMGIMIMTGIFILWSCIQNIWWASVNMTLIWNMNTKAYLKCLSHFK